MLHNLPLAHPKPDAQKFIDILMGRLKEDYVPLVEYIVVITCSPTFYVGKLFSFEKIPN